MKEEGPHSKKKKKKGWLSWEMERKKEQKTRFVEAYFTNRDSKTTRMRGVGDELM